MMNMKKRCIAICLCVMFALALSACGMFQSDASAPEDAGVITPVDGYAEGQLEDVLRTAFFDFSVNSAYTCQELDSYTAADGSQLLVAEITVQNTSDYDMPMFDSDFQAQWGGTGDDDFSIPISRPFTDNQAPASYSIPVDEAVTYTHVYEVPADATEFSISFQEYFEDETMGDVFFVYFTL